MCLGRGRSKLHARASREHGFIGGASGVRALKQVERTRLGLLLAAGCGLVTPALALSSTSGGGARVRVALAARQSLYHLPLLLAEQLGYFRKVGLSIEWVPTESGAMALAAVQSGQADVMSGAFEHVFMRSDRAALQAFVMFARTPQLSLGLSTRRSAQEPGAADLRGSRIGISARQSGTHWVASQWVRRAGLDAQDVSYVEVGTSNQALEALRNGQIDLLCQPDPQINGLEQRGEVVLLAETRTLSGTRKLFGSTMPGGCLLASPEGLMRHPELVQALTDGVVLALRWLRTAGPIDLLKTLPSPYWIGDRAVYLGAFERLRESFSTDGKIDDESALASWRHHQRIAGAARDTGGGWLARAFTNEFAVRSRQRWAT